MKNPCKNKINSWTKMQSQPFKLDTLHKLDWQIVFDNQMTQVFKELFSLHIIIFEGIFRNKFFEINSPFTFAFFFVGFFLALNYSLDSQTFLQQWHDVHQRVF
jgi:hypothetical protein